jgi:hypothetical protein
MKEQPMLTAYRELLVDVLLLALAAVPARADFDLDWYTCDGGGDLWTNGGNFELSGTIGQPDATIAMTGGAFELAGGFWSGLGAGPPLLFGDLNCDGAVTFQDINPFVQYVSNFSAWLAAHPDCPPENGDINQDGIYPSFADINPFVTLLTGGQ